MSNNIEKIYSLTPLQQGMIYYRVLDKDSSNYHVQNAFWLSEELSQKVVEKALLLLAKKHEVLRTAFVIPESTGIPRQVILKNRNIEFSYEEAEDSKEDIKQRFINEDLERGFDLQKDSLIRVKLVRFGEKKNWLLFSFHHIIMDGWCISLVFEDFLKYVELLSKGTDEVQIAKTIEEEKKNISAYSDYVIWQEKKNSPQALEFWKDYLDGYKEVAAIEPMVKPEKTEKQMEVVVRGLSESDSEQIKNVASTNQVTVNSVVEAAWGIVLKTFCDLDDVVFGKVVSGRNVPLKGIEKVVGMFINTVPCRVKFEDNMSLLELCKNLHINGMESQEYEHCALADIQSNTDKGSKLIQTLIAFENYYQTEAKSTVKADFAREQTNYPLTVTFFIGETGLKFQIMYNPNEFKQDEVENIADVLLQVLKSIPSKLNHKVNDVEYMYESAFKKVVEEFNQTFVPLDDSKSLIDHFLTQVQKHKDKPAVLSEEKSLTYGQLKEKAEQIASKLYSMGVEKGDYVGILTEKNVDIIASIYGILMAGAVYVPLSLDNPKERMEQILNDCKPKVIIAANESIESDVPIIRTSYTYEVNENWKKPDTNFDSLAYVMYTSGTTGKPKGVMICQGSILNLVKNCNYTKLNEDSVIMQAGDIAFDASTFEIHGALLNGGSVFLARKEVLTDTQKMKELIHTKGINTMFATAALFNQILSIDPSVFDEMKFMLVGGEQLNDKFVRLYQSRKLPVLFTNGYGPTETTTFAVCCIMDQVREKAPIGKPLQNVQAYVMRGDRLCGIGMAGELCIAGRGVGKGYLNDKELTDKRFISNPFGEGLMYRTGDMVRWLPEGKIDYLGRMDNQVKIHGYRIELGEIETAMQSFSDIQQAVAIVRVDEEANKRIYAYFIADKKIDMEMYKQELSKKLPKYMMPYVIMQLEKFDLTRNGKIDIKSLPEPVFENKTEYVEPKNELQTKMVKIVAEVIGVDKIGITDHFMELGCDSIKAMQLTSKLSAFGEKISISDIYMYDTVEELERFINNKKNIEMTDDTYSHNTFKDAYEVKEWLNDQIEQYQSKFLEQKVSRKIPLTAGQLRISGSMTLMSGCLIHLDGNISIQKLSKVVKDIMNEQGLLRCTMRKNLLLEKEQFEYYEVPFADLSECVDEVKLELKDYMTSRFYGLQDEKKTRNETLLHRIVAIKYSADETILYFPINHIIFDAMSGEILSSQIKRRYYDIEVKKEETVDFADYARRLKKGPRGVNSANIVDFLKIKEFAKSCSALGKSKDVDLNQEINNYIITLDLGIDSDRLDKKDMWNISYSVFLKLLEYNYGSREVPFLVLCVNRQYEGVNYNHIIGEFVDALPVCDSLNQPLKYENIQERIQWMSDHNVNISTLLFDKGVLMSHMEVFKAFMKAGPYMEKIAYFNYLGMYNDVVEQNTQIQTEKLLEEVSGVTRTVDIKVRQDKINMVVFGPVGKEHELENVLQNYLNQIVEPYK